MIQTESWLVSVRVLVGPAYVLSKTCKNKVQACMSNVKGAQKRLTKKKESDALVMPYLELIASVHLNMGYEVSVLRGPLSVLHVHGLLQSSRQLGNFLLLCSFNNFVGLLTSF